VTSRRSPLPALTVSCGSVVSKTPIKGTLTWKTQYETFAGWDRLRYRRRDAAAGAAATGILIAAPSTGEHEIVNCPKRQRWICQAISIIQRRKMER
jgi:hypothetical protein